VQAFLRLPVGTLFFELLLMLGVPHQTAAQVSTEKPATMSVLHLRGAPQGGELKLWIKARTFEVATRPGEDLPQSQGRGRKNQHRPGDEDARHHRENTWERTQDSSE